MRCEKRLLFSNTAVIIELLKLGSSPSTVSRKQILPQVQYFYFCP